MTRTLKSNLTYRIKNVNANKKHVIFFGLPCLQKYANAFDVQFKEEPKLTLDLMDDYGIGFSEDSWGPTVRKKSLRLQHWYINNFCFQRCTYPEHTCTFRNKYLEKIAQLIRIPYTAKPEVKEKLEKYTR